MSFAKDFTPYEKTHINSFQDVFQAHTHRQNRSKISSYYTMNLYSRPNFLKEFNDVRQTEEGLINLLTNFHETKLNAFGEHITLENMVKIREQQENLARLHFEMNNQQSNKQLPQLSIPININNSSGISTPTVSNEQQIKQNPNGANGLNNVRFQSSQSNSGTCGGNNKACGGASIYILSIPDPIMSKPFSKTNMIKLIQNLRNLCESIELLQLKNNTCE